MKLPPVKKLTRRQAWKYRQAIDAVYGPEEQSFISRPRKQSKQESALATAAADGWGRGFKEAKERYEQEAQEKDKALAARARSIHLETLKTARDLFSSFGQMMDVLNRTMQSEKGQL